MDNRDEIYPSVRNNEKTDKILETPVKTVDSRPWKTVMSLRDRNKVNLMTLSWLTCEISGLWGKVWETRWQVVDTLNSGRSAENLGRLSKAAGGNRVVETWELQREREPGDSRVHSEYSAGFSMCVTKPPELERNHTKGLEGTVLGYFRRAGKSACSHRLGWKTARLTGY